jgi:hypothetical protein
METHVTLKIPEELYRRAQRLARANNRPVADVLAESIVLEEDEEIEEADLASSDDEWSALEAAAAAPNEFVGEMAFVTAYRAIDWGSKPAADFVRAIRLALEAGAHMAARKLAQTGAEKYPEDEALQRWAYLLAPPKVTVLKQPPNPGITANRDWMKANWETYQGKWVALRSGELLTVADSMDGVLEQVGDVKGTGILVTRVY